MKAKTFLLSLLMMVTMVGYAKDIKTVVLSTSPEMHCASCETRIKNGLKFESGVKEITTDLTAKTVTVKYDADKTSVDKIKTALAKVKYKAEVCDMKATAATTTAIKGNKTVNPKAFKSSNATKVAKVKNAKSNNTAVKASANATTTKALVQDAAEDK